MVVCLKIFIRESLFYVRKLGIKSHRQNSSKARGPTQEIGKRRRSIARNYAKSVNLKNAIRALPDLRKGHNDETLQQERCTAERWDLARSVYKLKNHGQSSRCMGNASTLFEKARGARIRGRFRQDPTTVVTANGEVQTNEEAQVYVHDLDLFVTVQILDDTSCRPVIRKTLRRTRFFK